MPRYTNKRMLSFRSFEGFQTMTIQEFEEKLNQIKHKHLKELRSLLIILFLTGCRPAEALMLQPKNFSTNKKIVWVTIPSLKGGETSSVPIPMKHALVQELHDYVFSFLPEFYLFKNLLSKTIQFKKIKNEKGEIIRVPYYYETSRKIRFWVNKFFGVPAYFFRHNRLTISAMRGATMRQLMLLKRAKNEKSVYPYLHHSLVEKKKIAKFIL